MASLKRDVGKIHPELKETVAMFEDITYRWNYSEVFSDFLDYGVRQHLVTFPAIEETEEEKRFLSKYSDKEQKLFQGMYENMARLTRERTNLWAAKGQRTDTGWYDPLGSFYEEISSDGKKSQMGQFFSPPSIANFMAQCTIGVDESGKIEKGEPLIVAEPCSGSGRMILAANAVYPGCYSCCNDLDTMCAKMTAINMCLNGAVGQVTCGDGLDIIGTSFRFGYTVMPMMMYFQGLQIPDEETKFRIDLVMSTLRLTNPSFNKMYCLVPLKKEDCMIYADPKLRTLCQDSAKERKKSGASLEERLTRLGL